MIADQAKPLGYEQLRAANRLLRANVNVRMLMFAAAHWRHRLTALLRPEPQPDAAGYVIFHTARTGSTALTDQLRQHPQISANGEMFHPHRRLHVERHWSRRLCPHKGYLSAVISNARRRWRRKSSAMKANGCAAHGFQLLQADIDVLGLSLREAVAQCRRLGFEHFIYLERRNVLRKHISARLAKINTFWHRRKDEAPRADYRSTLRVDFADGGRISGRPHHSMLARLDAEQAHNQSMRDYLNEARQRGERWLHLVYEDDIEQTPRAAYEKVCEFLDMKATRTKCNVLRLNPKPLSQIIENFDEVREHLSGTRYEAMLEG